MDVKRSAGSSNPSPSFVNNDCVSKSATALSVVVAMGSLAIGIICLIGTLNLTPQLASGLLLGGAAVGTICGLVAKKGSNCGPALIGLIINVALFVPGILGCYSSTVVGWITVGSFIAGVGSMSCLLSSLVGFGAMHKNGLSRQSTR